MGDDAAGYLQLGGGWSCGPYDVRIAQNQSRRLCMPKQSCMGHCQVMAFLVS